MKTNKVIFLFTFLIFTISLRAQEFAPIGAEWYYTEGFAFSGNIDYLLISSENDTIIKGKNCKQLNCDELCWNPSGIQFIYYSNDSLFHFNSDLDTFQLITNFNSKKGDSWDILSQDWDESIDTVTVIVDSLSTITINANLLKQLYVTYHLKDHNPEGTVLQDYTYNSIIIERIGDINYLFNFPVNAGLMCDDNYSEGLRCYQDSELGFYSTGIADSCTYTYVWTGIENENLDQGIKIYPNPTADWIEIKSEIHLDYKVTLFNVNGEILFIEYKNGDSRLDLSEINTGIYFIQISREDRILGISKIIKN